MKPTYFKEIENPISYEGKESRNPFSFRYYDKNMKVGNKTMSGHLRFSVAYWHTFMGAGLDIFGDPSMKRAWHTSTDPLTRARETMDAAFEFIQKLGIDYYCFHDRDIAPEGKT